MNKVSFQSLWLMVISFICIILHASTLLGYTKISKSPDIGLITSAVVFLASLGMFIINQRDTKEKNK